MLRSCPLVFNNHWFRFAENFPLSDIPRLRARLNINFLGHDEMLSYGAGRIIAKPQSETSTLP